MTREGKQQLSIAYGSPGVRGLDGEGGLLHRRNTKNKPKQKKNQKNQNPKNPNKNPGQESMDGNFSRRPKTAAAATDRGCSVAGERKRMHRGGGSEGKGGLGIINYCQLNFISQENKITICRHTDENEEMRFSQDGFVKNILHQIKLISLCGKVIGYVDILEVSKAFDTVFQTSS